MDAAPHRCPHPSDSPTGGEAGITPAITEDCNAGPGGRCVPAPGAGGGGYYDMALWTDNPVWNGLNFQQEQGHYFHYNFIAVNDNTGFGTCQFTAQAFGDLDGDTTLFSTYERSGAADQNGVNGAAGLYIDQEVE
jgi:type IV pilus assembly protein PilA